MKTSLTSKCLFLTTIRHFESGFARSGLLGVYCSTTATICFVNHFEVCKQLWTFWKFLRITRSGVIVYIVKLCFSQVQKFTHILVVSLYVRRFSRNQGCSQPHNPGWVSFTFLIFPSNFWSFFLIFLQTLLIFFLILVLRVGESSTREGPGYATGRNPHCDDQVL